MVKNNSSNQDYTNNADGWDLTGGTSARRKLTVTGGDVTVTASGSNTHVFQNISGTVYESGGTDVSIADGGTGASTKAGGFDALSPMTTSGDIIYGGASGTGTRLAVGSSGQVLKISSGIPAWSDTAGGSTPSTKTTNYTIAGTDTVIFADATSGSITITLPVASGLAGYKFYIKRIDGSANSCSVARSSSDTIDGLTSVSLAQQYTAISVVSNGSAWYIL